jgi:hypothetical protein
LSTTCNLPVAHNQNVTDAINHQQENEKYWIFASAIDFILSLSQTLSDLLIKRQINVNSDFVQKPDK